MADDLDRIRAALTDNYVIEREVGRGGMATVYLAEDVKHHRTVAIKVLHPDIAASLGRERFLREIEIVANLRHRGILPLYDSGEADGLLFYVMPYVEGPTLRDRLDKEKQLPVEEALRITSELAAALDEAHSHGVVHRDIKPENVLFEGDQPLIADFGVATALEEAGGEKLTRTGVAVGTPSYMSPEQAAGGEADARSDEYALACVLYEMLGGTPPFTGPTPQAVMARHALDPVPDLGTVRSTVPEGVIGAVERAMSKVPADRYPSAGDFAEALARGEEKRAGTASPHVSRRLAWGLPASLVVVVLLGLGTWRTLRSAIPTEASSIAILPLAPAMEGDSVLALLGKNIAGAVTYNLYGVGGIETQPHLSMLAAVGDESLSNEQAAEVAARFGATSVLTGTVEHAGFEGHVRATVTLLTTDGLSFMALASATSHADSINILTDELTAALLAEIWRKGEPPTPHVQEALKTDSLRALRKFLEGEAAYAGGGGGYMILAAEAYKEAAQIDTTFWLAAAMYGNAQSSWVEHDGLVDATLDSAIVQRLLTHVDDLLEPQRSWVRAAPWRFGLNAEAWYPGTTRKELLDGYRELATRHRDFWPIVADYGDAAFHEGSLWGHSRTDARRTFKRALELNPDIGWVVHHEALARDSGQVGRYQEMFKRAEANESWLDSLPKDPWGAFWGFCRSYAVEGVDSALVRRGRDVMRGRVVAGDPENFFTASASQFVAYMFNRPRCLIEFFGPLLEVEPNRFNRGWYGLVLASGWAATGAWDSAMAHVRDVVPAGTGAALPAYRIGVAGRWLGYVDAEDIRALREHAQYAVDTVESSWQPARHILLAEFAWLDGMLAVADGDLEGIRESRARIEDEEGWVARRFARSLGAFELSVEGDLEAAADSLYALEMFVPPEEEPILWNFRLREEMPINQAVNRLAASRWLLALGDTARARELLAWQEVMHPPALKLNGFVVGLASLELARIEAPRGNPERAREHYLWFLRADPVDYYADLGIEARAAVARIDAELAAEDATVTGEPADG